MCIVESTVQRNTNVCIIQLTEMPWLHFLSSGPVWAIVIANFCLDWGGFTLVTNIPTFYKEVLLFDIESVSSRWANVVGIIGFIGWRSDKFRSFRPI